MMIIFIIFIIYYDLLYFYVNQFNYAQLYLEFRKLVE